MLGSSCQASPCCCAKVSSSARVVSSSGRTCQPGPKRRIDCIAARPAGPLPRRRAPLAEAIPANGGREHYARAALVPGPDGPMVKLFGRQDSSVLSVLSAADCLAVLPPLAGARAAGEPVEYIQL